MLIIKPFGQTKTDTTRKIQRYESHDLQDITKFVKSEAKLTIAQWISILDKFAKKTKGHSKTHQRII